MICPCNSNKEFQNCCEPILSGDRRAETAEQLMRARYTAYTRVDMDFIAQTHDPKTTTSLDMKANTEWAKKTKWLGLEILRTEEGQTGDEKGFVEFKAKFDSGSGEQVHHEHSFFTKRNDIWYFTDGKNPTIQTIRRTEPKIGRNSLCPCGSGKKFKKCCE